VSGLPYGARILVNGFREATNADSTARLARGLFLTGLAQSPRLHPLADEDLLPALNKLEAGAVLPVTGRALDGLLTQLRAAYWIDGEIHKAGGRVSLVLHLLRAGDRSLLAERAFRDMRAVTVAATEAATWLRRTAGESTSSLHANGASAVEYFSQS